jgi:N-acylglucosamine 2-epimerase
MRHGLDHEFGGIMTCLDRNGALLDTDKGVWQQGRFAWMLGYLFNTVERRPEWLAAATGTLRFMEAHCFDTDGRMFFQVTRDGRPIRKRRYAFSEAFAAIAFGEHAGAVGSAHSKALAEKLYHIYDSHIPSPPKFTDTRPMKTIGKPMIQIAVCQRLRDSIGLDCADEHIDRAIAEIRRDFMKPEIGCCMENVGADGKRIDSFDGRLLNPGHAIEAAWFMMQEGKIRRNPEYVRAGCDILEWMWERGWDLEYGGMLYFRDVDGKPVAEYWHDMKFWWPQNETIIATLLAYQLTGDGKYATMHTRIHDYAYALFPDPEYGDWFGYFHRDGRLSSPLKGNIFKGCFHVPRQALECWTIAREIHAGEVGLFKE